MKISSIITTVEFAKEIETLVRDKNISYFEALMLFADKRGLELETVGQLARQSQTIKAKLSEECQQLNLIEKEARLPV